MGIENSKFANVACVTIVSKNYISLARVLCDSFLEHHPGAKFYVVLVDKNEGFINPDKELFELLEMRDVGIPNPDIFPYQYNILELNTAVKPFALKHILETTNAEKIAYIDPDIMVYSPMNMVWDNLDDHSVVLTPHMREPFDDNCHPSELNILQSGTYNLGFIGLKNNGNALKLLDWWAERLYLQCLVDIPRGLFTDQKWIDLVPAYFEDTFILHNPGYNIAYWNLHERQLSLCAEQGFLVDGNPLAFFHFSGFDPRNPKLLSKHQDRHNLIEDETIAKIYAIYAELLLSADLVATKQWPYAYQYLPNGVKNTDHIQLIVRACLEKQLQFPSPEYDTENFCKFLMTPNSAVFGTQIAPIFHAVLLKRNDVAEAYPNAWTGKCDGYSHWLKSSGGFETGLAQLFENYIDSASNLNPVEKIVNIFDSRNDVKEYTGEWWLCTKNLKSFIDWMEEFITSEYEHIFESDVKVFKKAAEGGIRKVLYFYMLRTDLQKAFLCINSQSTLDEFKNWLLSELSNINNIDRHDIEIFYFWAKKSSKLLTKILLLNNVHVRGLLGSFPNIFNLDSLYSLPILSDSSYSREDIINWMWNEVYEDKIDHLISIYNGSIYIQQLFPDFYSSSESKKECVEFLCERLHSQKIISSDIIDDIRTTLSDAELKTKHVNLIGYFDTPTGVGQAGRSLAKILNKSPYNCKFINIPTQYVNSESIDFAENGAIFGLASFNSKATIVSANADATEGVHELVGMKYFRGKRIGYWFWETEKLPEKWVSSKHYYDEIWTASDYCKSAIEQTISREVKVLPLVIDITATSVNPRRDEFGLPEKSTLFGYFFDQKSFIERKNPLAVIEAFSKAFSKEDNVWLVLKVNTPTPGNYRYESLKSKTRHLNVIWLEETYSREKTDRLMDCLDSYISLHRSEGFGLTCLEALAKGKETIATNYSGNLQFMNEDMHHLVKAARTKIAKTVGPYAKGDYWSEPDIDDASKKMVQVHNDLINGKSRKKELISSVNKICSVDVLASQIRL